jgi:hypothetical protein
MRKGVLAVPLYFVAVGIGHLALAMSWYERTTGLPRDGQAFSGTMLLGVGLVVLGSLATLAALTFERGWRAFARASLTGIVLAVAMVAYTASRGYLLGGVTGGTPYIADAQPDLFVILLAGIAAYWISHIAARLQERTRSS